MMTIVDQFVMSDDDERHVDQVSVSISFSRIKEH